MWATAATPIPALKGFRLQSLIISTDGTASAVEKARTVLDLAYAGQLRPPVTLTENVTDHSGQLDGFEQLADVVMFASLPIAGASLAVSVAGGLTDCKRPFSLLRLAGTPLAVLRQSSPSKARSRSCSAPPRPSPPRFS